MTTAASPAGRRPVAAAMSAVIAMALTRVCLGATPPAVAIDGDRLTVNDRTAFPLAIYVANNPDLLTGDPGAMARILDELADSPFKVLVNYAGPEGTPEARRQYLDALAERGLYEVYSLKDFFQRGVWGASPFLRGRSEEEAIREEVRKLRDHPAILGWYISDEEVDAEAVARHHRWVRASDPSRFTLTLVNQPDPVKLAPFLEAGDVLAIDAYPIGNGGRITDVAAYTDALVTTTKQAKPAWVVIQAYGGYMNRADFRDIPGATVPLDAMRARSRAPTPREMRAMTFLALTHGASGLVVYYHKDIRMAFDRELRWESVKAIGREVRKLSPILLARDIDPRHLYADNDQVHWRAKSMPEGPVLVAVNSATDTQSVKIRFPLEVTDVRVHSGAGFAHALERELLLILDGYEALVVQVSLAEAIDWDAPAGGRPVAPACPARPPGAAHWRFEEADGTEVKSDPAHRGTLGRLAGGVERSTATPPADALPGGVVSQRALRFPGTAEGVLIMDDVDALDVGDGDFTLEAWIHPRSAANRPVVAGKAITGWHEDRGYELRLRPTDAGGTPGYHLCFAASFLDPSLRSGTLSLGAWRHVAVTRTGRIVRLFVDARLVDQATLAPPADLRSSQRFAIGCSAREGGDGDPGSTFEGSIDEVRLLIGQALAPRQFLFAGGEAF